jgi:hypothetical protein
MCFASRLAFLAIAFAFPSACLAQSEPLRGRAAEPATRVRVLLIVDTNLKGADADGTRVLRSGMKKNLENLTWMFRQAFQGNPGRLDLTVLSGADASPDKIRQHLRDLPQMPNETLFIYYGGHGAIDPDKSDYVLLDRIRKRYGTGKLTAEQRGKLRRELLNAVGDRTLDNGHYFAMSSGDLGRREVLDAMRSKKPQLAVLMTDCCSEVVQRSAASQVMLAFTSSSERSVNIARINQLLLEQVGTVDLNAAQPGELAWIVDNEGGFFTNAFIAACSDQSDLIERHSKVQSVRSSGHFGPIEIWESVGPLRTISMDLDRDAFVSWPEAFAATQHHTYRFSGVKQLPCMQRLDLPRRARAR